jgi:glycosyltransferase involved in cell wall biosynthesis
MRFAMQENDLITVIFPIYNAEKTIEKAVDSAINQTYHNLEILLIDDGSTDRTGYLVDRYAEMDQRVNVLHLPNGGEGRTRNVGVSEAKGTLITYCDADDFMQEDMIEKLYQSLLINDADISICSWKYVDENGRKLNWRTPELSSCRLNSIEAQKIFLTSVNFEGFCWNKLIKKKLFQDNQIQYDESCVSYCDIVANYRLLQSADIVSFVEEQLYDYYQMSTSCIHTPTIQKHYDYSKVMGQVKELAKAHGLQEEGEKYQTYRLCKHLFGIYKDRYSEAMMSDELKKYYCETYAKYLKKNFVKEIRLAFEYSDENPWKFIVKIFLVARYYQYLRKK